jgi:hypothetical protein
MEKAYVISAFMREGSEPKPIVAVLFVPDPPTGKMLKNMGLYNINSCEQAAIKGTRPSEPTAFYFEKTPAAKDVVICKIAPDGRLTEVDRKQGEPHTIIPALEGVAADRFINPRGAITASDAPKTLQSVRPSKPPERVPSSGRNQSRPPG